MTRRLWSRVRRICLVGAAGLMFVVLAGATYQGVATALERRQFPHPGRLVDVGGHQLHLNCEGEGQPTVVLEGPAVGMSSVWGWVQPALGRLTRVCSYDRSGLGWSEAGEEGYAPSRAVDELRLLLQRSGERAPYVLAGDEFGAALSKVYAGRYRADLIALVLIDPPMSFDGRYRELDANSGAWPWFARVGLLRGTGWLARLAGGLPDTAAGPLRAFLNRPDHLTRAADELSHRSQTLQAATDTQLDPSLMVVTVQADDPPGEMFSLNDQSHAARVVSAIRVVIETARSGPIVGGLSTP